MLDASGQSTAGLDLAGRSIGQDARIEIDLDLATSQMPADQFLRERILDVALDRAAQGACAIRPVLARGLDNPVGHFRHDGNPQPAIGEVRVQLIDQQAQNPPQVVVRQRLEDDDLVDAVDEFRVERPLHLAEHHVRHGARDLALIGRLEPERRLLLDEAGADVRRHDDDRVLEVHPVAQTIGQVAVLEHLQQDVEQVRVRLLDLVEQHDRVRIPLHLLGELTALFVADVSGRRANQLADRVLLHVLGHVEADQRVVAAEQEIGQRAGKLRLADAGRTEEHEAADRPRRVLQIRRASAESRARPPKSPSPG